MSGYRSAGLVILIGVASLAAACGDADQNALVGYRANTPSSSTPGGDPNATTDTNESTPSGTPSSSSDGGSPPQAPPVGSLACTSCHGDATRVAIAGADPNVLAAPPKGTKGETATTTKAVGAHQAHLNKGTFSKPVACNECHVVPTATNHSNAVVDMAFGTLAKTGNKTPAWDGTSCTASYCHGNFTGGNTTAAPAWTGAAMTCTSCHGAPPATGDHLRGAHQFACSECHGNGYTANAVNKTLHINGVKNVGGAGSKITTYNAGNRACTPTCHGTQTW